MDMLNNWGKVHHVSRYALSNQTGMATGLLLPLIKP